MVEEKNKKLNIKHKKSNGAIYYGVEKETGELVNIEIAERGLACNCVCLVCGMPLEARKGVERKHHFAHESNTECFYSSEISIYYAFYKLLEEKKEFFCPDVILKFNSGKNDEVVENGKKVVLNSVEFPLKFENYPPKLTCNVRKKKFQIILDFDNYYDKNDYQIIKEYGNANDISVVVIHLPSADLLSAKDELQKYLVTADHKEWIYNTKEENWNQKFREKSEKVKPFYDGFICPIQKLKRHNVYIANSNDCKQCQYCYEYNDSDIRCLAYNYIKHIEDFEKSEAERKGHFYETNHIKPIKKISDYSCPNCGAPMVQRKNKKGEIFAGCSKYPNCKGRRSVVQRTGEVIIYDNERYK